MSIIDITNKILTDASEKADGITASAKIKKKEISNKTDSLKKTIETEAIKKIDKILEENKKRIITAAQQGVKIKIDSTKRTIVDNIFNEAIERLATLPDEDYVNIILHMLKTIPSDANGKIIAPINKKHLTEGAVKKAGLGYKIETSKDFKMGFIFSEEKTESNFVFEDIIKSKKDSVETEVARILFKTQKD